MDVMKSIEACLDLASPNWRQILAGEKDVLDLLFFKARQPGATVDVLLDELLEEDCLSCSFK